MDRKPPSETTYEPQTRDGFEVRIADLKRDRDRYKQALDDVLEHGCIFCAATARKALGLPL